MGASSRFDLVIFDCDGVLVDSEIIAARIEVEALCEIGYAITLDGVLDRFVGLSARSMYAIVEAELGRPLPEGFAARIEARTLAAFETELAPIAGVAEAIDATSRPYCVASSSSPERIRFSLARTGLLDRLAPHLFSAAMVANGKPAPDLFLLAAARMGAVPARSVVIEDSTAGVRAGRAAGMHVLGFAGGGHVRGRGHEARLGAAGADRVFSDMAELAGLLEEGTLEAETLEAEMLEAKTFED